MGKPAGYWQWSAERRAAYDRDVAENEALGKALREARERKAGPECAHCGDPAATVDADGRCRFCAATRVFHIGATDDRERFVARGTGL
jgi:5-methylcytosine-specific restriction endonuclease McrA